MTDSAAEPRPETVKAGVLTPWGVDKLPLPPPTSLREWKRFIGPGVLLAGASVAAGEWLFGPAVSAQFGGTLLWLATISIVLQVFLNLEVGRYALYCGEPALVGFFRTRPGPRLWTPVYLLLDTQNLWPFMAANAAVPLAAAMLGHLPGDGMTSLVGLSVTENQLVRVLGYVIFVVAFIPLIFGGAVYRMVERIMTIKIVIVLATLSVIVVLMVSGRNIREVTTGLFRFGAIPLRADSVIDGRHFTWTERAGGDVYTVKGTIESGRPLVTSFVVKRDNRKKTYAIGEAVPGDLESRLRRQVQRAARLARPGRFLVEHTDEEVTLRVEGDKAPDGTWLPTRFLVTEAGEARRYERLDQVPEPMKSRFQALIENRGLEVGNLFTYVFRHRRLPDLDWALLAAFFSIAGLGGFSNSMYSNYARDKGWGMGRRVGAIPSAIGGRTITLSHVGKVFHINAESLVRWRGWVRHILIDQAGIWMLVCLLGMALPCMISLEFIRNAPVSGERGAAMMADGIANSYPAHGQLLWSLMLFCGFLVLGPGQVFAAETLARRWTDIIWAVSSRARKLQGNQVKYIYYGILTVYGLWGLFALSLFDALTLATIGAVIGNFALGGSALHTLYINRNFLPPELRPGWLNQLGLLLMGIAALGISAIGFPMLWS